MSPSPAGRPLADAALRATPTAGLSTYLLGRRVAVAVAVAVAGARAGAWRMVTPPESGRLPAGRMVELPGRGSTYAIAVPGRAETG